MAYTKKINWKFVYYGVKNAWAIPEVIGRQFIFIVKQHAPLSVVYNTSNLFNYIKDYIYQSNLDEETK